MTDHKQYSPADFNLTKSAYSVNDFCQITGLGRNSIYSAAKAGDLVITKIGKCSRICAPDGAAFLNKRRSAALTRKGEVL